MSSSIIVLGSSGWIGHYLVPALRKRSPNSHITAIFRTNRPAFAASLAEIVASIDDAGTLEKLPPATVINLNRGEEAADFALHRRIIEIQNRNSSRYIYASSFNAVDAELSRPHHENDPAASQSVYGKFKARCEQELLKTCGRPLAFRFAATHGWAPNRMARTQEFLEKLRKGENIIVTKGILQNRSFVGDLAEQIATLSLADQAQGIFHLGTSDFSEEIDFLKKMAQAFGYDASQVIAGEANQCNAVMLMERLPSLLSHGDALPTEAETISKVSSQLELASYRKGSS